MPLGPLVVGDEGLQRRDQQGEIEVQRLAGLDRPRSAGRPQHDAVARLFVDCASAASFIAPGRRQAKLAGGGSGC